MGCSKSTSFHPLIFQSGDGTCLALGYAHLLTLWDWRDNTLKAVLPMLTTATPSSTAIAVSTPMASTSALSAKLQRTPALPSAKASAKAAAEAAHAPITHMTFVGLTPYIVAATAHVVSLRGAR